VGYRHTHTSTARIPCVSTCGTEHVRATCTRCQEAFDHRVLIETCGDWACPPCSESIVDAAEQSSRGGCFVLGLFGLIMAVVMELLT
jgi:hypothetical protein